MIINNDYDVGVLLSLNTNISSHFKGNSTFDIEFDNNKCFIYVNKLLVDGMQEEILKSLIPLFKYIKHIKPKLTGDESQSTILLDKLDKIKTIINESINDFKSQLKQMKTAINKLEEIHSEFTKKLSIFTNIIELIEN